MNIKSLITTSAITLSGIVLISSSAIAQEGPGPGKPPGKNISPEERLEKMKTDLALTPDQAESVKGILIETKGAMDKLRDDSSLSSDEKKAEGREILQSSKSKIDAMLTPEQKEKMAAKREGQKGEKPEKGEKPAKKLKNKDKTTTDQTAG